MSYSQCSRDDQCNNGGKCVTSGGWSKCICVYDFIGVTCNWHEKELSIESKLVDIVFYFLNGTLLIPVNLVQNYTTEDTSVLNQLANVLIGILKNPEPINKEQFNCIIELGKYLTQIDYITGGRMEDFEQRNIFTAFDSVLKYVYYEVRKDIYAFYVLAETTAYIDEIGRASCRERVSSPV